MAWYILAFSVCILMIAMALSVQMRARRAKAAQRDAAVEAVEDRLTAETAATSERRATPAPETPPAAAPTAPAAPVLPAAPAGGSVPQPVATGDGSKLVRSLPDWRTLLAPLQQIPGLKGWAILTAEGLTYDADLDPQVRTAVEALGLTGTAGQAAELLQFGRWQKLTLETAGGLVVVQPMAAGLALLVVAAPETSLGLLRYHLARLQDNFYLEA